MMYSKEVQETPTMTFVTFSEAHPDFSAYIVMGGWDYEGENALSTRLFDSKAMAVTYAENLLRNESYDHAQVSVISNDGTIWKMPGSTKKYRLENDKLQDTEVVVAYV